jgi:hypothetical protein
MASLLRSVKVYSPISRFTYVKTNVTSRFLQVASSSQTNSGSCQLVKGIARLEQTILPHRNQLVNHHLYASIRSIDDLRWFMENHVYAVWDFMSLLKSLQINLTCVTIPWKPVGSPSLRRFINEIVLGEESDVDVNGRETSHFEMYLAAMREVGASTTSIEAFLALLEEGQSVENALKIANAPLPAQTFVQHTFRVINSGSLPSIASTFAFGREDLIPDMFQSALDNIGANQDNFAPQFRYYLKRHIEVDGDSHAGLAQKMVEEICQSNTDWRMAEQTAVESLQARRRLWDGVLSGLPGSNH